VHDGHHHQPLGVGALILGSMSLFLRHLPVFLLIALVPTVGLNIFSTLILPDALDPRPLGGGGLGDGDAGPSPRVLLTWALSVVVILLMMGVLVLAAHSARIDRHVLIGAVVGRTLSAAPALLLLGALYIALVGMGLVALLIPGLYLMARFAVLPMAVLADDAGFSGLRRASQLTEGYRWPILGAMLIMLLLTTAITLAVFLAPVLVMDGTVETAPGDPDFAILMLSQSLATAAQYALIAVFIAQLYLRLREIKDGSAVGDVAAIFE